MGYTSVKFTNVYREETIHLKVNDHAQPKKQLFLDQKRPFPFEKRSKANITSWEYVKNILRLTYHPNKNVWYVMMMMMMMMMIDLLFYVQFFEVLH